MDEKTTGNVSDNRSLDTRRWKEQDDAGHIKGSRQEGSSENTRDMAPEDDNSEYNKLDDRETAGGTETV